MAEQELDLVIQKVAEAIDEQVGRPACLAGKCELWLTYVKRTGGSDAAVMPGRKLIIDAAGPTELLYAIAAEVVLSVFGDEIRVVDDLPNLLLRLLDRRGEVHLPGAPDLAQEAQIWLKVTVHRHEPGLWQRLFGRGQEPGPRTP